MLTTLAALTELTAAHHPRMALWSMASGERREIGDVHAQVARAAEGLRLRGVRRGDIVGVLLPNSVEMVIVQLAVLRVGAALAPLPLPLSAASLDAAMERLARVVERADMRVLVTSLGDLPAIQGLKVVVATAEALLESPPIEVAADVRPDDLALVQFTSGSTSSPKGVALTHAQALAGIRASAAGGRVSADDVYAVWLPLSHDMGLISTLAHILQGANVHVSSPPAFIRRPGAWLQAFAKIGGTVYTGPNFSYAWMRDAVSPAAAAALDLSRWRLAINGAEPIDPAVLRSFTEHFAPAGLRPEVLCPSYGMAEATVGICFSELDRAPLVIWVDREQLRDGRAIDVPADHPRARGVVSVGRPLEGMAVRIVTDGRVLPDGDIGEIQARGPSIMRGYHGDPAATAASFDGAWLRTGDLGFLKEGRLYVTGRIKELIKVRGAGHFPDDLEARVRGLTGVYRHRCVAFGVVDAGSERVVVLVESKLEGEAGSALVEAARQALVAVLGPVAVEVHLVPPKTVTVTTSGKLQRLPMRLAFEAGTLPLRS